MRLIQLIKFYKSGVKSWEHPFQIPHQNFTAIKDCSQLICLTAKPGCTSKVLLEVSQWWVYIPRVQWYDTVWCTCEFSRPCARGLLLDIDSSPSLQKCMSSINTGVDVLASACKGGFATPCIFHSLQENHGMDVWLGSMRAAATAFAIW